MCIECPSRPGLWGSSSKDKPHLVSELMGRGGVRVSSVLECWAIPDCDASDGEVLRCRCLSQARCVRPVFALFLKISNLTSFPASGLNSAAYSSHKS